MKTPITSYPFLFINNAATLESTPPDIATRTFNLVFIWKKIS